MIKKTLLALNILFLVLAFAKITLADDDDEFIPKLNVSGKGDIMIEPDLAFASITVETKALTAAEAAKQN
ncbi:MAG TPA: SIMPL domain-containing protein, partial [Thermodesulfobacteriota bacterium]|nr:SIMPL domain-containing protein [Thermodesulfobacteriota bacterium]